MVEKELQLESGKYTRIVNKVIDELVKFPLLGSELAICLFVIRKTYGFHKKEDQISLTQFESGTERSRPTLVKSLRKLVDMGILKLVVKGSDKHQKSIWSFNKYYKEWRGEEDVQLVNSPLPDKLVKLRRRTGKAKAKKLVKGALHTKDNTKDNTKDTYSLRELDKNIPLFIDLFRGINPTYQSLFGRKDQRSATVRLLKIKSVEEWEKIIKFIEKTRGWQYAPRISTPCQLEQKYADLETYASTLKTNNQNKGRGVAE